MAKALYCWRCKKEIPMLEEHEWQEVLPALSQGVQHIKDYRTRTGASLIEAKEQAFGTGALKRYYELTGYLETNPNALWHHRLELFGPPCAACGRPLRTPRAKMCAECGAPRSKSETA
ncbi:MAG TPA: hypothetical protein VNF99_01655 [Stellaceae bacterium]|nr:hypothetical protein [Stellaceae bacterium]